MIKTLDEICDFLSGNAWKASSFQDSGIPIIRINNMNSNDNDFVYWQDIYDKKYLIKKGDLLLSLSGTIKTFRWNGPDALLNQRIVKITTKKNIDINIDWIYYQLYYVIEIIANKGKHAIIRNVSINDLRKFEIDVPDIDIQNKIVAILDRANILIDKRNEAIALNKELLRAIFLDMFGNIVFLNKTEKSKPLGKYISIKHGFAFKSEFFDNKGEFILLTPGNFNEGGGYRDRGEKQKYYIGDIPKDYVLKEGALLVAMTEQAPGLLGSPLIVPQKNSFLHNQRLGLVEIKENIVDSIFLFYLFNTGMMRNIIHVRSNGVKVRHTSPTKIEGVEVEMPNYESQKRFGHYAKTIEANLSINNNSKLSIEILFKSLIQKIFNGQLNFNVDFELDALIREIDLQKKVNDLSKIAGDIAYLQRLVDKLNNQEFKEKDLYDKAKHGAFQLMAEKEEKKKIIQEYDEKSKSLKLALI